MTDRSGSQIDHLNIAVPDLTRARVFYDPVLACINIHPVLDIPATATDAAMTGYGWPDTKPFFWLVDRGAVGTNMHLAFTVGTRDQVHTFYDTAASLDAQLLHPPASTPSTTSTTSGPSSSTLTASTSKPSATSPEYSRAGLMINDVLSMGTPRRSADPQQGQAFDEVPAA